MGANQQVFEQLNKLRGSKTIIVGIGNTLKGDDGAGPFICEQLRKAGVNAEVIDAGTVPENYIQPIVKNAPQNLLVIDAIDFGVSPGEIGIFRPEQLSSLVISTHILSPRHFVDMIRQDLDADVYFVGIQPAQTRIGESVSAEVADAIQWLVGTLAEIFPPEE